ncbi:unnamed protein product [Danaus chrysippus]|uniref:(African queen) hypothetical protein n=1 Tax=Danaus chrysippus TaxID=151541 RepID=A0A8J2MK34_9NEOP|nr:unnamed protein product [Danaus chrysippus]
MDKEESPRTSKYNETVLTPTMRQNTKGEIVVEKFVESLMSSEKYLKIIETIEDRMTHLESIFHERSNSILKYLLEVLRAVKNPPAEVMERAFKNLKHDLDRLKFSVSHKTGTAPKLRVIYYRMD